MSAQQAFLGVLWKISRFACKRFLAPQVTYEWTFCAPNKNGNRADVVFLVNGIPLAIVESKNSKLPDAMERAVKQLRRYELQTPEMMTMPQVFNVTQLIESLVTNG